MYNTPPRVGILTTHGSQETLINYNTCLLFVSLPPLLDLDPTIYHPFMKWNMGFNASLGTNGMKTHSKGGNLHSPKEYEEIMVPYS